MKKTIILLTKILIKLFGAVGRGTSLPGLIALKLCPTILSQLHLPATVIAVTGSNGKTSTAEMIAQTLSQNGKSVIYNREGSNQTEGIATLLLKHCDLKGVINYDVAVLECDERYTRFIFRHIKPTHLVLTNLFRDQLTRNAHPFYVAKYIKEAIAEIPDATLIVNADSPLIYSMSTQQQNCIYYGTDKNKHSKNDSEALYNDCHYCPVCKEPLQYNYFQFANQGMYHCSRCSFAHPKTDFTVESADFDKCEMILNGEKLKLQFASFYNVYNICAAFSCAVTVGIPPKESALALSEMISKSGRQTTFYAGNNKGLLLISKHENSIAYNQNLEYITGQQKPCSLLIIVDKISRKYFTGETSWLWDISFEALKDTCVKEVILSGCHAYDLALRFELAQLDYIDIITEPDIKNAVRHLSTVQNRQIYVMTCFSDKDDFFSEVEVTSPTAK